MPAAYYDQLRVKLTESPVKIKEDLNALQVKFFQAEVETFELNKLSNDKIAGA